MRRRLLPPPLFLNYISVTFSLCNISPKSFQSFIVHLFYLSCSAVNHSISQKAFCIPAAAFICFRLFVLLSQRLLGSVSTRSDGNVSHPVCSTNYPAIQMKAEQLKYNFYFSLCWLQLLSFENWADVFDDSGSCEGTRSGLSDQPDQLVAVTQQRFRGI